MPSRQVRSAGLWLGAALLVFFAVRSVRAARPEHDLSPEVGAREMEGVWSMRDPASLHPPTQIILERGGAYTFRLVRADGRRRDVHGRWKLLRVMGMEGRDYRLEGMRLRLYPGGEMRPLAGGGEAGGRIRWESAEPVHLRVIRISGQLQVVPDFPVSQRWNGRPGLTLLFPFSGD